MTYLPSGCAVETRNFSYIIEVRQLNDRHVIRSKIVSDKRPTKLQESYRGEMTERVEIDSLFRVDWGGYGSEFFHVHDGREELQIISHAKSADDGKQVGFLFLQNG